MLDDALDALNDRDREAVLLRCLEGRAFAEIGATLRLTEDAARMRVDRALDKLRALLERRGVTSTSGALAAVLANQAAATAPAGLAASIAGSAMSGAATAAGAGTLATVWYFMSASKVAVSFAAAGALAVGVTVYQSSQAGAAATELARVRTDHAALAARLSSLEIGASAAEKALADREAAFERARLAEVADRATAALRAAAEEEKAKQEKALQQFLASHPELQKLRFEANRAGLKASSAGQVRNAGDTPERI